MGPQRSREGRAGPGRTPLWKAGQHEEAGDLGQKESLRVLPRLGRQNDSEKCNFSGSFPWGGRRKGKGCSITWKPLVLDVMRPADFAICTYFKSVAVNMRNAKTMSLPPSPFYSPEKTEVIRCFHLLHPLSVHSKVKLL